jgi:hypothetical protein
VNKRLAQVALVLRLGASRAFYETLGFRVFMGDQAKNWLILQNETSTIGLFQGMFSKNTLTFKSGWDRKGATLPDFDDVRAIQRTLKSRGSHARAGGERVDIRTGKPDGDGSRWESNPAG